MASTSSCIYIHSKLYLSPSFSKGSSSSFSISRLMPISCISKQLKYSRGLTFSQTKIPMWPSSSSSSSSSCFQVFSLPAPKATVTGKTWDKSVLNSEVPVLVEFYASWCGPCAMVHRVIDEIAAEYAGRVNCFTLHADNELQIADEYNIKAVPVVMLFKNGAKCETVVGTMPKEFYIAAIERVLFS